MKIRQANLRAVPNVGNLADLASISPQLVFFWFCRTFHG